MFWLWDSEEENASSLNTTDVDNTTLDEQIDDQLKILESVNKCLAPLVLIILPALEIFLLYRVNVYGYVARTMDQFSNLDEQEKKFIRLGFLAELQLILYGTSFCYIASVLLSSFLGPLPAPFFALLTVFLMALFSSNSFVNSHERVYMPRLEGVIVQSYIILAASVPVPLVVFFDTVYMHYLPVPSMSNLNFISIDHTYDELPLPQWFTLSRPLVYILPSFVYTGMNFFMAHFCFFLWCRAFHYAVGREFWFSVNTDSTKSEDSML